MSKLLLCASVSFLLFLNGCRTDPVRREYLEIAQMPAQQAQVRVCSDRVDRQIDLHIYATTSVEPPDLRIAHYIARCGSAGVDPVIDRLNRGESDLHVERLLSLLNTIHTINGYTFNQIQLQKIDEAVDRMKDEDYKPSSKKIAQSLRHTR